MRYLAETTIAGTLSAVVYVALEHFNVFQRLPFALRCLMGGFLFAVIGTCVNIVVNRIISRP